MKLFILLAYKKQLWLNLPLLRLVMNLHNSHKEFWEIYIDWSIHITDHFVTLWFWMMHSCNCHVFVYYAHTILHLHDWLCHFYNGNILNHVGYFFTSCFVHCHFDAIIFSSLGNEKPLKVKFELSLKVFPLCLK